MITTGMLFLVVFELMSEKCAYLSQISAFPSLWLTGGVGRQ